MSQEIGGGLVDPKAITGADRLKNKNLGELVGAVRIDSVPTGEAQRLAAEGKFFPLTVDANGFLRVTLPEGTEVKTVELETLLRIETLLEKLVEIGLQMK